jgi:NAD(P)H dehydrogenase (quinone)
MRVLVVYCHPDPSSYANSLHSAVLESLMGAGHSVTDLDLYGEGFNPVFDIKDRANYGTDKYVQSIAKYAQQLAEAEGLVLVYPAWWYGMPAMLKGYFDRVWAPGVSYDIKPPGRTVDTSRLSALRRIAVVTTYGSPWWLVRLYMGDPTRKIVSRGVRQLCGRGCRVEWHVQYDMNEPKPERLTKFLARVKRRFADW